MNVDCRVYRIKTQVTETGGAILEGERVKEETRYTGEVKTVRNKETCFIGLTPLCGLH